MGKRKFTVKDKGDVEMVMGLFFRDNYNKSNFDIRCDNKPLSITEVRATIQDNYVGPGRYSVLFNIWGKVIDEMGNTNENVHYTALCKTDVIADLDDAPIIEINDVTIVLRRQIF